MIESKISLHGFVELEKALKELPGELAERVLVSAVRKSADDVRVLAAQLAPTRSGEYARAMGSSRANAKQARLPGFLKANIVTRRVRRFDRNAVAYSVGFTKKAFYGMFVELGTRFARARPFLRPALEAKRDIALETLRRELAAGIDASWRRIYRPARSRR